MNPLDGMNLFGRTFSCTCGRTHNIEPREIVYDDDAMSQLPEVCARATTDRRVAVLMDARTRTAAGEKLSQPGQWDRLRERLAPMLRPPKKIFDCLSRSGASCRAKHIGCDRSKLLASLLHAREIRSRFTILDLACMVGVMPDCAEEIIEQWS